jgi:hypothetical protein
MVESLSKAKGMHKKESITNIPKEEDEEFLVVQDELERHYNQLKYIATAQTDQLRLAKLGCFVNPK